MPMKCFRVPSPVFLSHLIFIDHRSVFIACSLLRAFETCIFGHPTWITVFPPFCITFYRNFPVTACYSVFLSFLTLAPLISLVFAVFCRREPLFIWINLILWSFQKVVEKTHMFLCSVTRERVSSSISISLKDWFSTSLRLPLVSALVWGSFYFWIFIWDLARSPAVAHFFIRL